MPLKYNIDKEIRRLPGNYWANVLKLSDAVGRHPTTIMGWAATPQGSKRGMSVDALYAMAEYFNIRVDDLINKPQVASQK